MSYIVALHNKTKTKGFDIAVVNKEVAELAEEIAEMLESVYQFGDDDYLKGIAAVLRALLSADQLRHLRQSSNGGFVSILLLLEKFTQSIHI